RRPDRRRLSAGGALLLDGAAAARHLIRTARERGRAGIRAVGEAWDMTLLTLTRTDYEMTLDLHGLCSEEGHMTERTAGRHPRRERGPAGRIPRRGPRERARESRSA